MSTPEEIHRDRLYEALLVNDFALVMEFLRTADAEQGTYLDGVLWTLAGKLQVVGVKPEALQWRSAAARSGI